MSIAAEDPHTDLAPREVKLCQLQHRAFSVVPGIAFRRAATDGEKVMVVPLGEREASVSMQAVRREFNIAQDSDDGRMLSLIDAALDHVPGIALGEALPEEVISGDASWQPEPRHLWLAAARLRAGLLSWLRPGREIEPDPSQLMENLVTDPDLREQVQAAFEQAAHALGLPRAEDALALVDQLAKELSHIEALRDWLLGRVQSLVRLLAALPPQRGQDRQRSEMLQRVGFLASTALRQLHDHFDVIDAQTGEVMAALRNAEQQILFIRQNRNELHTELLAWKDVLDAWDHMPDGQSEAFWEALSATYHLLAQRHLPQSAWRRSLGELQGATTRAQEMHW
ncbi:MAG: hypothetical protein P4L66_02805 [Acetobacteraceae bacterium]|nr:hypothetical protein [Acetobacteraceae bacterium]